ncbi:TPA: cation:proton antiporter [Vibrio vulnificus]|uniref:cation:proton antiporter n=2 Tax=Vibrio vulnificus TaxID=672 RepID=UPI0005F1BDA7|nr:cation:proton antiporter [Vibrio vulnificus]EID4388441.1 cation:proton antiporter [Vibrio vulnificus]EKD7163871.1 cation:proton antiporter [Vibrio vulnificus]EKZ9202283.1 cation:proton antiporter [Vibrio vulnificus]ELV8738704.1 cation:proton antiporter [Vibrio vulnificus]MCA3973583.1 cation:proton antiporter [Vibrio vulnificus]
MHFDSGLLALLFVIIALFIGALVRHLLKGSQVPYTVALLILGIAIGLAHRGNIFADNYTFIGETLSLASEIDPHLFLFLFLPTLIFESAFAMEVHLFRRMFTQIVILAVPGLMLAIWLTAELVAWVLPEYWQWSWALCLMFGALISATDPVAVVALLKEVSSRKRLETLIEGESLLNDGTAIVFFSLFYGWVLMEFSNPGEAITAPPWQAVAQFFVVVFVGLAVGLILGGLCILWIDRVFNDPMIEISLTIAAAYSAFFISENFHVSGVVAVVTLAIMFASVGRTRISPEVAGFLHHFWEMMAHMANTLIFLLVGILVAIRVPLDDKEAWLALFVLYLGIMAIRACSITVFMPILKRIGIGITYEKAVVLCWGGLRGAVSLALAMTVASSDIIPKQIGDHVLFLCAGIVVLTILFNGSTMGHVLKWLNLSSLPPGKQATVDKAQHEINRALHDMLPKMMTSDFLKGADWETVKQGAKLQVLKECNSPTEITQDELHTAYLRRLLETERKHYWTQFSQGLIGKQATNKLVEAVEHALDGDPVIGPRNELFTTWRLPDWVEPLRQYNSWNKLLLKVYFRRLALGYDVARGFIQAQEALESHIDTLAPDAEIAVMVRQQVELNKRLTFERIESLRMSFPEIIQALQSQAATRLLLNRERAVINDQLKQAVLDKPEAQKLLNMVEERMAALQKESIFDKSQEQKLINDIPWARELKSKTREELTSWIEHTVYDAGQLICENQRPLNRIGIVSRGSITELYETRSDDNLEKVRTTIGPGETFALISLLTGKTNAQYVSDTPTDIMWLPVDKLKLLMNQDPNLTAVVCQLFKQLKSV